jgi:hypothetical protein
MRVCDIEVGSIYRLKSSPNYGFIKVLSIVKPKHDPYRIRCIHSSNMNFDFGINRNFLSREIIKLNN